MMKDKRGYDTVTPITCWGVIEHSDSKSGRKTSGSLFRQYQGHDISCGVLPPDFDFELVHKLRGANRMRSGNVCRCTTNRRQKLGLKSESFVSKTLRLGSVTTFLLVSCYEVTGCNSKELHVFESPVVLGN